MTHKIRTCLDSFFMAGINYNKTDATTRGNFTINDDQYAAMCGIAAMIGISEFFILSTCNRTEIYGFADSASSLAELLCTQTAGIKQTFLEHAYMKQGVDVVQHLFDVGAGLQSQILGDYEITSQIKLAAKLARQQGYLGAFTDRLINQVLQSSKNIRNNTGLSNGTVSAAFAAIQYIKQSVGNVTDKNILLLGVGKIGINTCKNVVDYLETRNITVINRTGEKAYELATELGIKSASYEQLPKYINWADIILVATNAPTPIILKSQLKGAGKKLIIDLSVPYNVDQTVKELPGIDLVNIDELSKLRDETLQKRIAEVPKARAIIHEHMNEFLVWSEMRKNAPIIQAVKEKLSNMQQSSTVPSAYTATPSSRSELNIAHEQCIKRIIKNMALKMRTGYHPGCSYIEAINDFITARVA